jgi:hypothetical protein
MVVVVQSGRKCRAEAADADASDSSRERREQDMICRMMLVVKMVEWLAQAIEPVSLRSRARGRNELDAMADPASRTRPRARFEAPRLETGYPDANSHQ